MARRALTRSEAEARAALLRVHGYELALDLTGHGPTFHSETVVRFGAALGASTFIEAVARPDRVVLNGRELDPVAVSDGFRIALDGLDVENELVVSGCFAYTNSGEGLHRFTDPVDDAVYLYTEFAVAEASRVFAVFDQPDLKAPFRLEVAAPPTWLVRSNAATPEPVPSGDGSASIWRFAPGPVISSYLVAIIAGPYREWRGTARTSDGRTVPLGLLTRESLAAHAEPDVMLELVDRGIRFFESRYGVPFPYEKYDQIFVPEYNWGAMENVGAVTFNEGYLFRSRVPEARLERRTEVVLHELSHMWFGDLVTMRWWNDLWLNESFATWASALATVEVGGYRDAWASFAASEKTRATRQDQLPTTHPVVARIEDTADVEVNFDAITYDKGASVLKQLVAWVGLDAFHAGVGAYLRANAEGNATLAELLVELERTSGRDLGEWSRLWLETAGVNTLRAELEVDEDGTIASFAIVQTADDPQHPTLRPHRLAVGCYAASDGRVRRVLRHELDVVGPRTEVPELVGLARPELILLNDDDLSYAKIRLDEASAHFAKTHLDELEDPVARAVVWGAAWDATRDAELPATDFVRLVLANIGHETRSVQRTLTLQQLELVLERYVAPEHRERVAADAGDALWALAGLAAAGSDAQLEFAKAFARIASTPSHAGLLHALLDGSTRLDGLEIDTDLRWDLITALAALGEADDPMIDAALAGDDTAKGRLLAETARAARPDPAAKDAAWRRVASDERLSNDLARALAAGWRLAKPPALLEPSVRPYFAMLQSAWANRSFTMGEILVTALFPAPLATPGLATAARGWLESNAGPAPLRRLVSEAYAELIRALAAQLADSDALGLGGR